MVLRTGVQIANRRSIGTTLKFTGIPAEMSITVKQDCPNLSNMNAVYHKKPQDQHKL